MKRQIFSTNASHKLATGVNGTSTITLGGDLGGGTAVLQFSDGIGGYMDVDATGAAMTVGSVSTLLHGIDKPVFLTIAGGSVINAVVETSIVK